MNLFSRTQSPDVFTIERHGGLTLIIASPALGGFDLDVSAAT